MTLQSLKELKEHLLLGRTLYVRHTDEAVIVRKVEVLYRPDRAEPQCIVEVEFESEEPCPKALSLCNARQQRQIWVGPYTGHPSPDIHIWEGLVDLELLCEVPFGTPAAEVLFGKNE